MQLGEGETIKFKLAVSSNKHERVVCGADCIFSEFEGGQVASFGSGYTAVSFVNCQFANNTVMPNKYFDDNHAIIEARKRLFSDGLAATEEWGRKHNVYDVLGLVASVRAHLPFCGHIPTLCMSICIKATYTCSLLQMSHTSCFIHVHATLSAARAWSSHKDLGIMFVTG
jgi:hypothetical protein